MKDNNENSNKKNMILLTIIAIVTMVVVLVGATFAYLASNVQDNGNVEITANTDAGSDLLLIEPGQNLNILANVENFGENVEQKYIDDSTISRVFYQTTEGEKSIKYDVTLDIISNDFEYSSGVCYSSKPSTEGDNILTSYNADFEGCIVSNHWIKTNDGYNCYKNAPDTVVTQKFYNNESACLSNNAYSWEVKAVPELVFDLYKVDDSFNNTTCEASGVCINTTNRTITGDNNSNCTGTGKAWVSNKWSDEGCFKLAFTQDITTLTDDVLVFNDEVISANNSSTTSVYKPVITLFNFEHNQIINGKKGFSAVLNFQVDKGE